MEEHEGSGSPARPWTFIVPRNELSLATDMEEHSHSLNDSLRMKTTQQAANFFLLIGLVVAASAQLVSAKEELPSQAKPVEGIVMPIPKEIFISLDRFKNVNWRAVQRPDIVNWKSRGDQPQVATLLGITLAEGLIAVGAKDPVEVKNIGTRVLVLARALGVGQTALRRSRSIVDSAEQGNWKAARGEWDGVLSDLETGMIALRSEKLSQLVSIGGWLRGTEALCALALQDYSRERANLIQQPILVERLATQLREMDTETRNQPRVVNMTKGIESIRQLIQNDGGHLSEDAVRNVGSICKKLVHDASAKD